MLFFSTIIIICNDFILILIYSIYESMNIVTMVTGHSMKECTGEVRVKQGEVSTCVRIIFSCPLYYM